MSSTEIAKGFKKLNPGPLDEWYGPYASTAAACAAIPNSTIGGVNFRTGKTVGIIGNGTTKEYWWRDNTTDMDLIEKGYGNSLNFASLETNLLKIPQPNSDLSFSAITGGASAFNPTTGILTPSGSGTFLSAYTNVDMIEMTFQKAGEWVVVGKGSDFLIAVSFLSGQSLKIFSNGTYQNGTYIFPAGGIPSDSTFVRVNVSGLKVYIYYSIDGVTYTLYGSVFKEMISGYETPRLGTVKFGPTKAVSWITTVLVLSGGYVVVPDSIKSSQMADTADLIFTDSASPSGVSKIKKEGLFQAVKKDLVFRKGLSVAFNFQPIPTAATVTYGAASGSLSVGGGGGTYSVAISSKPLNRIVLNNVEWIAIGRGVDFGIILATRGTPGKLQKVTSTGTLANVTLSAGGFPTTAIPSDATKIEIKKYNGFIIVSYSTDGLIFTEWGRLLISNIAGYTESDFGILNISSSIVAGAETTETSGTDNGYKFIDENILEKSADNNDYLLLLNKTEISGAKKISVPNFVTQFGIPVPPYFGKRGVVYGDSITDEYNAAAGSYTERIKTKLSLSEVTKFGYVGRSIGNSVNGSFMGTGQWDAILATNPDILFLLGGTNDFGGTGGTDIGLMTSTNMNETVGALRAFIRYMKANRPAMDLIICTPLPRANQNTPNAKGFILKDYVDAIINVGQQYSVPVVDLFRNSGIAFDVAQSRAMYLPDDLHPNSAGYDKFTSIQANFAKSLK